MKKQFLIISLIVGLFLVISGGGAMAVDVPHDGDVLITGDATDVDSEEATLKIIQPERNAPYRTSEGFEYRDAVPLLVEGKSDISLEPTRDLNTIMVIRSYGESESELRFDNGSSVFATTDGGKASYEIDPTDKSSMNAFIYTTGNDHILRFAPGPWTGSALADVRLRKVGTNYSDNNIELQIAAQTESDASLVFLKGSITDAPFGDPGTDTAKIYRPAGLDDLSIAVTDNETTPSLIDVMTFQSGTGNVGIGSIDPLAKLDVRGDVYIEGKVGIGIEPDLYSLGLNVHQDSWWSGIQITNKWVGDGNGLQIYEGGGSDRTSFFISDPGVSMSLLPGWDDNTLSSNTGVIIGKLGFNNPEGNFRLYVEGDTNVNGDIYVNGVFHTSDKKFKKGIKVIDSALSKITNIKGVSYEWKTDEFKDRKFSEGTHFGVIGQDIEKILPDIVTENSKGEKSVAYTELIPILIEAMKEQQKTITALSDEVKELRQEVKLKGSMAMADSNLN